MKIEVYADGSATTADKPGGWGYVVVINDKKYAECAGHMEKASNNDAEMEAAIQGLAAVLKYTSEMDRLDFGHTGQIRPRTVTLVSDSQLILGWASGRYKFKQLDKIKKYQALTALMARLQADTRWVRGHSGDEYNERCDKLANQARRGITSDRRETVAGETRIGTKKSGTVCVWYKDTLKIIDLETNIVENYNRDIHGARGGTLEVREDRAR